MTTQGSNFRNGTLNSLYVCHGNEILPRATPCLPACTTTLLFSFKRVGSGVLMIDGFNRSHHQD